MSAMVTPGLLRQGIAEAFGLTDQLEKIDVHLRNLREAGLIAKAKTGRGAAEMGPRDAAGLLIAVAASELVKDSVKSVESYGSLAVDPSSLSVYGNRLLSDLRAEIPLVDLPETHSFFDAVCRTLTLLGTDSFFDRGLREHLSRRHRVSADTEYLFLRFFLPYRAASIIYGMRRVGQVQFLYGSLPVRDPRVAWDLRNLQTDGRLLTVRIVDKEALTKIAKIVAPTDRHSARENSL